MKKLLSINDVMSCIVSSLSIVPYSMYTVSIVM